MKLFSSLRYVLALAICGLIAMCSPILCVTAIAQATAHFSYVMSTVGNGLVYPTGVAVDTAGNVYIADKLNNRIVKVPWTGSGYAAQTIVPTVGPGVVVGVAVDNSGNVYVSDGASQVLKVPWDGSNYGTQIVLNTATTDVNQAYGLALDSSSNLYISDPDGSRVQKIPWNGSTYGAPVSINKPGGTPVDVAVDSGNVYMVDPSVNDAVKAPWNGSTYGALATVRSGLGNPNGVAVDGSGNV